MGLNDQRENVSLICLQFNLDCLTIDSVFKIQEFYLQQKEVNTEEILVALRSERILFVI